jgi:SPP1 family predicted phage head-tail adaptor
MIRSGGLRTRALLQRRVETRNDSGGHVATDANVDTLWCRDTSTNGAGARQLREAQKLTTTLTHAIQFRYDARIAPTMRLVIGSQVLKIMAVIDPERMRREVLALCEELQPNG